jgi:uncharacterized protein involved in type VI secretion and phage assembly
MESEWARVIGPAAGKDRGLMMLPQVGDEVVIAFEHDDVHYPYVIGSVWNGKGKPGDLSQHDGSFVLQSQKFLHLKSKDSISLKSDKDITIEVGGESKEKASKDISVESTGGAVNEKSAKEFVIEAGTEVKIKAGTNVTLEAGANLEIKANGMLKIQASGALQLKGSQVMLG